MVRVYQLAKQLNITSKRVLEVAEILGINVKAHQSSLSEEDVSKIIKYLKKNRRIGIVFNKTVLTLIDFIKNALKKRTFTNGLFLGLTAFTIFGFSISNANDSVAEVEIIDTVEQIVKAVRPKNKPIAKVLFLNAFLIKSIRVSTVLLKTIPIRLFFFRYFIIFDTSSSLKED